MLCTCRSRRLKTWKIDDFYGPVEKRPRVGTQPDADIVVNVEEKTDLEDFESGTNMPDKPKEVTDTVKQCVSTCIYLYPWSFMFEVVSP